MGKTPESARGSNEKKHDILMRTSCYHIQGALGSNKKNMGRTPERCLGF